MRTTTRIAWIGASLLAAATEVVFAAAPEICRLQGGNTKTIWGAGFTPGQTEVRAANLPFDTNQALAALAATPYRGRDLLPLTPPNDAQQLNILDTDARGLVMAVEFQPHYNAEGFYDARAGRQVCWVKNSDGWSKPWLVKSAQPWWVSPEQAAPGQTVRVFGRALDTQLVALKARDSGKVTPVSSFQHGQHPLYEVRVNLPADLAPGDYDLFVHNGAGGEAGWGGPVKLTVAPAPAPSPVAFCDLIGVRIMDRGNISLLGPLVFGNTVRFSEVTGFRYAPSFHIQPTWLQNADPNQRAAVDLQSAKHKIAGLPATAPLKDWNIIEGSHLYDGPRGIRVAPEARHTQLRQNAIHVDGEAVVNEPGEAGK